jgi:hypothetical protein
MSRNNDVFQVLVTKGNQEILSVGQEVTDLTPGQIGFFDFDTNLAVANGASVKRNFYAAVGIDSDGDGVTDDIMKSAGSHIQTRNMVFYNYHQYNAGAPMKFVVKDYIAKCETEYSLKLELRNKEIYRTQGFNQFTKTYNMVTGCCDDCEATCASGDANEITKDLKFLINTDEAGLITAIAIARQALAVLVHGTAGDIAAGDEVSDADLNALMLFNKAQASPDDFVYTDLEVTTVTQKLRAFGNINMMYFFPRETVVLPILQEGFTCNGALEITQQAVFEEGAGYDVKELEYMAKGWKESPYRVSTLNGVADEKFYNTVVTEKYDMFALTYDQFSIGAWLEYLNNEATQIMIPTTDTVTRNAVLAFLNAALAKGDFTPQAV